MTTRYESSKYKTCNLSFLQFKEKKPGKENIFHSHVFTTQQQQQPLLNVPN